MPELPSEYEIGLKKGDTVSTPPPNSALSRILMTSKIPASDEIGMSDFLFPLASALRNSPTPESVCLALAEIFHVQSDEVALLRLEQHSLRFLYPAHLRDTGAIPIFSSAIAAHTAVSKTAEIFNNFAQVKHASIFEMIAPPGTDVGEQKVPLRIQKLMSVPIIDHIQSKVLGVIQISRKGMEPQLIPDFTREEMHDVELAADLLSKAAFWVF